MKHIAKGTNNFSGNTPLPTFTGNRQAGTCAAGCGTGSSMSARADGQDKAA